MSVSSVYIREIAQGDGVNTTFTFPWKFIAAVDIMVYIDDQLQSPTTYDVKFPIDKERGEVVFNEAPAIGAIVVIRRCDNQQQARLFKNQQNFNAHEVEKAFDKLTLLVQEGFEELRRGALRMFSQSNLDYTIEPLDIDDGMLALDLPNKMYRQTSFTQKQVQAVIDEAVRSLDYTVKTMSWNGDVLTLRFGDGTTAKDVYSSNIVQIRANHDDKGHWWLEWSMDGQTWAGMGGATGGSVHNNLIGREEEDAHPIGAITGLQTALNAIAEEIEELQDVRDTVSDVERFVGYTPDGKLNAFLGLSDDNIDAQMANTASGGFMQFVDKTTGESGVIRMNKATPRLEYRSTTGAAAVELRDEGLFVNVGNVDDNFVKIPSAVDLGALVKRIYVDPDDMSTTKLDVIHFDVQTGVSTTEQVPLPVANETQAGVWNPSMYADFLNLQSTLDTLMGAQSIPSVDLQTETPTSTECTSAYKQATGQDPLSGSRLYNTYNQGVWLCLDGKSWVSISGTAVNNTIATRDVPGVVLSSVQDGQIYVETGGRMSVVGWDRINSNQTQFDQKLQDIQDAVGSLDLEAYVKRSGDTMTGDLTIRKNAPQFTLYDLASNTAGTLDYSGDAATQTLTAAIGTGSLSVVHNAGKLTVSTAQTGVLGTTANPWSRLYVQALHNGGMLSVPTSAGTLARVEDIPSLPPIISSVVRNESTGAITVEFSKIPTTKMVYYLSNGNEIGGSWALTTGTTYRFTPSVAKNVLDNDWGIKCS